VSEERQEVDRDADEILVLRSQNGDRDAFEKLFIGYERRVYNLIARMLGSAEAAEDLKQETFYRAYKSLGSFRRGAKFSTWLFRIAANLCLDEIKKKRLGTCSIDDVFEERNWQHIERQETSDPREEVERREVQRAVRQALAETPPHYRILLVLRYIEDLPYEDIARIVGCSVNALNVRLHRARQVLKKKMRPLSDALGYSEDEVWEGPK